MTSQLLTATNQPGVSGMSSATAVASSEPTFAAARARLMECMKKSAYQADHQVQILHLQAEAEALFVELQALKQQRLATQHAIAE